MIQEVTGETVKAGYYAVGTLQLDRTFVIDFVATVDAESCAKESLRKS